MSIWDLERETRNAVWSQTLTPDEWCACLVETDRALAALGQRDPMIASAARLATEALGDTRTTPDTPLVRSARSLRPLDEERDQWAARVRASMAQVTNDARVRNVSTAPIAMSLLGQAPAAPGLPRALDRWRVGVVAASAALAHPQLAVAVAYRQIDTLDRLKDRLNAVEFAGEATVSRERLLTLVDRATHHWSHAQATWRREAQTQGRPDERTVQQLHRFHQNAAQVEEALTAVRDSPTQHIWALAGSRVGGISEAAALFSRARPDEALAPLRHASDRLVEAAALLEANSRGAIADPRVARLDDVIEERSPAQEERSLTGPALATPPLTRAAADAVPTDPLEPAELHGLLERRDAGIAARAALAGVPEAVALVASATPEQLTALAREGDVAMARMVASVTDLAGHLAAKVPHQDRDEVVQDMLLIAMEKAAPSYNPTAGTKWSTWAASHMKWEVPRYFQARTDEQRRRDPADLLDRIERLTASTPSPESIVTGAAAHRDLLKHIENLSEPDRSIVAARLIPKNDDGDPPKFTDLAEQMGMTQPQVRHAYWRGMGAIREGISNADPDAASNSHCPERLDDLPAARQQPRGRSL